MRRWALGSGRLRIGPAFIREVARLMRDRSGATAIEYCLIASLVFLAIYGAIHNFGNSMNNMYNRVSSAVVGVL
jgi:pilus assembly protein Flp/PilA